MRRHRRLAVGASPLMLLALIGATILVIRATPYSHQIAYVWRDIHGVGALVARMGAEAKAKLMSISGTVSDDGKSLTADKDQKSWTVQNPEALKGHEGHHVSVRAHVYADKGEIHVMSVKMMGAAKKKE